MDVIKEEETSTECAPDTARTVDTQAEEVGKPSICEAAIETKSSKTRDESQDVSQPGYKTTMDASSLQIKIEVKTGQSRRIQTEESIHESLTSSDNARKSCLPTPPSSEPIDADEDVSLPPQAGKVERVFRFNRMWLDAGLSQGSTSFLGSEESVFSPTPTSDFDFSAMQMGISAIESGAETSAPKKVFDRKVLIKDTARFLKQRHLTESTLHSILPDDALDRLDETAKTCISRTKKDGHRCRNKLHHLPDEVINTFTAPSSLNPREDWAPIYEVLNELITISLCAGSHGPTAREELEALNYRMTELAVDRDARQVDSLQAHNLQLVETWITSVFKDCEKKIPKIQEDLAERRKPERQNPSQNIPLLVADERTATLTHARRKLSQQTTPDSPQAKKELMRRIQNFKPYQPSNVQTLSVPCAIRMELNKALTDRELRTKYLYIYWCPGNFGFIKIGVTNDVPSRLSSWENQCNHEVREHFQQKVSSDRIVVRHAYRVEKLVHTELKEVRHRETCRGCNRSHNEWFKTSVQHATDVIKKYSDWSLTEPYQFDKRSNKFKLNPQVGKSEIEELCRPVVVSETSNVDVAPSGSSSRGLRDGRKVPAI